MHLLQIVMLSILVTTETFYVIIRAVASKGESYHEVLREGKPGRVVGYLFSRAAQSAQWRIQLVG